MIDIRRIIGGLFALYGVVLVVVGLSDSSAELDKAQGVRINLWAGIAMVVIGSLMLAWSAMRPLRPAQPRSAQPRLAQPGLRSNQVATEDGDADGRTGEARTDAGDGPARSG